jgi:glucosamine 6-phosphate synthetase-like amidotransferase/phosphosugar isomerase protein
VARLEGAYSLCFVALDAPEEIVVAKHEAPLIVAHADGVGYCASDVAALIAHTRDVAALLDGQLARITPTGVEVVDLAGEPGRAAPLHGGLGPGLRRRSRASRTSCSRRSTSSRRRSPTRCATG